MSEIDELNYDTVDETSLELVTNKEELEGSLELEQDNTVLIVSFVYGVAVLSPFNAILSTLDFFTDAMPGYPISFVVSFAINGVMVLVVILCIAYSEVGSHKIKINLMFLLTAVLLIAVPFLTAFFAEKSAEASFWVTCTLLLVMGAITAVS